MRICVESKRQEAWLAKYRISFYADDRTGLLAAVLFSVLELMPRLQLAFCEFALDFSPLSDVDRSYVRRRTVFGKSRRDVSGANPFGDWWGSRRGAKRIVSYFKAPICGHRIEFKLRARFLRNYAIHNVLDLPKITKILPRHHILFVRVEKCRVEKRLQSSGFGAAEIAKVLDEVRKLENDSSSTSKKKWLRCWGIPFRRRTPTPRRNLDGRRHRTSQ
jgi:hypothetical protein